MTAPADASQPSAAAPSPFAPAADGSRPAPPLAPLLEQLSGGADLTAIRAAGHPTITPVIVMNDPGARVELL